jgi:hypothetical protein
LASARFGVAEVHQRNADTNLTENELVEEAIGDIFGE